MYKNSKVLPRSEISHKYRFRCRTDGKTCPSEKKKLKIRSILYNFGIFLSVIGLNESRIRLSDTTYQTVAVSEISDFNLSATYFEKKMNMFICWKAY